MNQEATTENRQMAENTAVKTVEGSVDGSTSPSDSTVQRKNQEITPSWRHWAAPFFWMISYLLCTLAVSFVFIALRQDPTDHALVITGLGGLLFIPLGLLALKRYPAAPEGEKSDPLSGRQRLFWLMALLGVQGASAGVVALYDVLSAYCPFMERAMRQYEELSGQITLEGSLGLVALITVLVAPITEEILFRGISFGRWRRVMPVWLAVLASSLAFSLFHGNWVQSTYTFLPGLVCGLALAKTGSLRLSIALHAIYNFVGGVLPQLLGTETHMMNLIYQVEIVLLILVLAQVFRNWFQKRRQAKSVIR